MAGIWSGMPFAHVHMAGHAADVCGVSPIRVECLAPRAWWGMDYSEIISYMS